MKSPFFFFDTADTEYVKQLWEKLKDEIDPKSVAGITTNPNAFHKIEANTIKQWKDKTLELCQLVSDIRGDDLGVVYVQQPNSRMTGKDVLVWAAEISKWGDEKTRVGLKIPPFKEVLNVTSKLSTVIGIEVNVTGVADCSTALRAFSYGVDYVSIIPGRMEEQGIDAKAQISFANQRNATAHGKSSKIITGSMRTIEGLKWVCEYNTVPTIGSRVWDKIFEESSIEEFKSFWKDAEETEQRFSPKVDESMITLSESFFKQMDELSKPVYEEFTKRFTKN